MSWYIAWFAYFEGSNQQNSVHPNFSSSPQMNLNLNLNLNPNWRLNGGQQLIQRHLLHYSKSESELSWNLSNSSNNNNVKNVSIVSIEFWQGNEIKEAKERQVEFISSMLKQ